MKGKARNVWIILTGRQHFFNLHFHTLLPMHCTNLIHRSAKRVCVQSVMHYCIAESGQWLKRNFKRFKWGTEQRNLFLQQSQNIFIFSAYTDACTSSCKIVVASKRPLILKCLTSNLKIRILLHTCRKLCFILALRIYWGINFCDGYLGVVQKPACPSETPYDPGEAPVYKKYFQIR